MKKLTIICPTFNNEGSIYILAERVSKVADVLSDFDVTLLFIDDCSKDKTRDEILSLNRKGLNLSIEYYFLTKNFGSYNSFLAGIHKAKGDFFVYLHADLQDPPELIPEMMSKLNSEIELVIANRIDRSDGGVFSSLYHWIIRRFGIPDIPKGGYDLILFSEKIRQEIVTISEKNTNIVYLISWLGFPYVSIPYKREKRHSGKSQWHFWKKVKLFLDSIFSFTDIPLFVIRLIGLLGVFTFCFEILLVFISPIYSYVFSLPTLLIAGVIIILEIIAEYIWRIHESVRNRPNFVIK